jgi:hypothetical protein
MRTSSVLLSAFTGLLLFIGADIIAQDKAAKAKKAPKAKAEPVVLDPYGRPEGSIVDQTARYYVWHDGQGWHMRTTAKGGRNFHGKIRTHDATIKSYKSVGLKNDKQKKTSTDSWRVNDARNELTFQFLTAQLSDGLDLVVDGEGEVEFELNIDKQKNPQAVFVGRGLQHPDTNPFRLPASPKRTGKQGDTASDSK